MYSLNYVMKLNNDLWIHSNDDNDAEIVTVKNSVQV